MTSICFRSTGEGLPIILIHGFCESAEIWDSFAPKIADGFKVIMVDLPGFGSSKLPKNHFSIKEIAKSLNQWVAFKGFNNAILIGHSLGGYVALSMIDQSPQLYAGLGLFHSTARTDTLAKKENRNKVMAFVKEHGVSRFIDSFVPGLYHLKDHKSIPFAHKIASKTIESTFLAYTKAMRDRSSTEEVLVKAMVPILIIAGEHDPVIDVASLEEQAKLNGNITFCILPNVGHMGQLEAENEAAQVVNDFARRVKSKR
jgi:pimeloyl-ACP methyl ester carboxylesterase